MKVGRDYRIDPDKFQATSSKGLKRKFAPGELLGHRKGVRGEILGYIPARRLLYLPSYRFVLEQYLSEQVAMLRYMAEQYPVVLLDVFINGDIDDPRTPLSHAALLKRFLDRLWSPYDEMVLE